MPTSKLTRVLSDGCSKSNAMVFPANGSAGLTALDRFRHFDQRANVLCGDIGHG